MWYVRVCIYTHMLAHVSSRACTTCPHHEVIHHIMCLHNTSPASPPHPHPHPQNTHRSSTPLASAYATFINTAINTHQATTGAHIGALIMEPILQGAGGMIMIDPLFQYQLVHVCRSRGVVVVFDEVFVGCWRLGVPSASVLLGCTPDIACYGKLLTGRCGGCGGVGIWVGVWVWMGVLMMLWGCSGCLSYHVRTPTCSYPHMFIHPHVHTPTCSYPHMFIHPHVHTPTCSYTHMFIHPIPIHPLPTPPHPLYTQVVLCPWQQQ